MGTDVLNNTLAELKSRAGIYQKATATRALDRCPFIIGVGALTVSTDENGKVITQNTLYPTQFSKNSVNQILNIKFRNVNDEIVTPEVYGRNEWYSKKLGELNDVIKTLEGFSK